MKTLFETFEELRVSVIELHDSSISEFANRMKTVRFNIAKFEDQFRASLRSSRQKRIQAWVLRNWGPGSPVYSGADAMGPAERVERLFEEACELMQAEGRPLDRATRILGTVYAKPASDDFAQEVGGISTCLLAYCESRNLSADGCEAAELARIEAIPAEHFHARHAAKQATGMAL